MKFILLLIILASVTLHSQSGIRLGMNISNLNINVKSFGINFNPSSKIGINLGLTHEFDFNQNMAIRPSVLFSIKGAKVKDGNESSTISLNYLEIPISFVYKFAPDENGVFVDFGPYFGVLLTSKVDGEKDESIKSLDAGILGGIGYNFEKYIIGLQMTRGLINISKEDSEEISIKNQNISIYGVYNF